LKSSRSRKLLTFPEKSQQYIESIGQALFSTRTLHSPFSLSQQVDFLEPPQLVPRGLLSRLSLLVGGGTGRPRTLRVGVLLGIVTVGVVSEKLLKLLKLLRLREGGIGLAVGVGMLVIVSLVSFSAGRAETPTVRTRATEKKVDGLIVIVVRCLKLKKKKIFFEKI